MKHIKMMHVPGQKPPAGNKQGPGSTLFCHPCEADGKQLPATGYCQDCRYYLCQKCYDAHTIPLQMRNHSLLDSTVMPKSPSVKASGQSSPKGSQQCPKHSDKVVEVFCVSHSTAVCLSCAFKHHRACDTEDINDAAYEYNQSQQYTGLDQTIDHLQTNFAAMNMNAASKITEIEKAGNKLLQDYKNFRAQVNAHFDNVEKDLLAQIQQTKDTDVQDVKDLQSKYQAMEAELAKQKANLKKYEHNNSDLYVVAKQASAYVHTLQQQLNSMPLPPSAASYTFKPNETLVKFLNNKDSLGTIDHLPKPTSSSMILSDRQQHVHQAQSQHLSTRPTLQHMPQQTSDFVSKPQSVPVTAPTHRLAYVSLIPMPDINVSASADNKLCDISGMALLPNGGMLVCDSRNCSVKIIDTFRNKITSSLRLLNGPADVTTMPHNEAAVTLPWLGQVQVISTKEALSIVRSFKVKNRCYGIGSTLDKFIISFLSPVKVEITDHNGQVLHTIATGDNGQPLFNWPKHVLVSNIEGQTMIYVSDSGANAVYKMTMSGQVVYTYRDQDLNRPNGLAITSSGDLFVCSSENSQVHLLSTIGRKIKTLSVRADGLKEPQAVSLSLTEKEIYVTNLDSNKMKVYKLK